MLAPWCSACLTARCRRSRSLSPRPHILRETLQNKAARVQREIMGYAILTQDARQSLRTISEALVFGRTIVTLLESARDLLLFGARNQSGGRSPVLSSCGSQSYVKETGRTDFRLSSGGLARLSPCLPHRTETQSECVCDVRSRRLFNIVGSFVLLIGPYKADRIAAAEKSFEELSVQIGRP